MSRLLAQPPWLGFQAVIKSAASAASPRTKNPRKNNEKMEGKLHVWAFYIGNPGLIQKSKVPKWVCRQTRAVFGSGQPFRAIFGPARGQIYGKMTKKMQVLARRAFTLVFINGFLGRGKKVVQQ